jgi:uncharacterized membrane protein
MPCVVNITALILVLIKRLSMTWGIHMELVKAILYVALYITQFLVVIKIISRPKKVLQLPCFILPCTQLTVKLALTRQ